MKYYKQIKDDYILSININSGGIEIDIDEYNVIKKAVDDIPQKDGYGYMLKTDLTWEEYELPIIEEWENESVVDIDSQYAEAGKILMGVSE